MDKVQIHSNSAGVLLDLLFAPEDDSAVSQPHSLFASVRQLADKVSQTLTEGCSLNFVFTVKSGRNDLTNFALSTL
jgi:hypothetical protein